MIGVKYSIREPPDRIYPLKVLAWTKTMMASERNLVDPDEPDLNSDINDEESLVPSHVGISTQQKKTVSFNYNARKKIEEYHEKKALISQAFDTFDDIN